MEDNKDIFEKILGDKEFGDIVKTWMLNKVYHRIRDSYWAKDDLCYGRWRTQQTCLGE